MVADAAANFWAQNQLVVALTLVLGLAALAGLVYVLATQRQRLTAFLGSSKLPVVMKFYSLVLGGAALAVFVMSLFARSRGLGDILYLFLWPMLALQLGLAFLPWQRLGQKPAGVVLAGVIGLLAFFIDRMVLQLAGYVT